MGRGTANSEIDRSKLDKKTYDYLLNNFNKFSKANKIKIALAIQMKCFTPSLIDQSTKVNNYVQIYRPEAYDKERVATSSRATNRSL